MNIVKIADLLSIEVSKMDSFTDADLSQVINQLQTLKEKYPLLKDDKISVFLNALRNYPKSFQEVMSHRVLVNFFADKNYSARHFATDAKIQNNRDTRFFMETFLMQELESFLFQKMEENNFELISPLIEVKSFFSISVSERLKEELIQKLKQAAIILKSPTGDTSKIGYIEDSNFYFFINAFKSHALEDKVKEVFTAVKNIYYKDQQSDFARRTFAAMKSYECIDLNFKEQISSFKSESEDSLTEYTQSKTKKYWLFSGIGVVALIIVFVLVKQLTKDNTDNTEVVVEDNVEYQSEPRKLDRYYTDMQFKIDSFDVFLTDYNPKEIRTLTPMKSIKTGDNPFQTLYENEPTGESSNNVRIENKTGYDMLLLENAVLYDSIQIPRTAHYIKSGDYLYVHFNRSDAKNSFNVYLGKKLASFQTNSNHLFVRRNSDVEYRFSELAPNASKILRKKYPADFDMVLRYDDGFLTTD